MTRTTSSGDVSSLTVEECIAAYTEMLRLHVREAGYPEPAPRDVDRLLNLDRARCHTVLARAVGGRLPNDVYNREDKWMKAARDHPDPRSWEYWLVMQNARTACLRLESQSFRLGEIARSINNLIQSRR